MERFMSKIAPILIVFSLSFSFPSLAILIQAPELKELQTSNELAKQLTSKEGFLSPFHDLSGLTTVNQTPRLRDPDSLIHDVRFQEGLQFAHITGSISPGTLIISDTGHGIPLLYQLLKIDEYDVEYALFYPEKYYFLTNRVFGQAQVYGDEIARMSAEDRSDKEKIYYIGFDVHRFNSFAKNLSPENQIIKPVELPLIEDLKKQGISRVLYLLEAHPLWMFYFGSRSLFEMISVDIVDYLALVNLEEEISVGVLGVDCRSAVDLDGREVVGRMPEGCKDPAVYNRLYPWGP